MAKNLKKFVNPRFLATIDLGLMKRLLARHDGKLGGFEPAVLDRDDAAARQALDDLLSGPEDAYPEGLRGDLHRIAELGDARGLEIILAQAVRRRIDLFPEMKTADGDAPTRAHDPKHLALRVFLEHSALFDAAADHMAMLTADRLHEYAGRTRGAAVDLTRERLEALRAGAAALFRDAFLGDFCRVGDYLDGDEINIVISHGSLVATMPVVNGAEPRVISIRAITHAVLRYSETTGVLRMARIRKAQQPAIAEMFAALILDRPGFFDGEEARDLYTLAPVERAGESFVFDHRHEPEIERVLIIEAAAELTARGASGEPRVVRTLRSRDLAGEALRHFRDTPVDFDGDWRLGELVFRIVFRGDGARKPQVTVTLRPRGTLQFRRTRHEEQVMTLLGRHGLITERDDVTLLDAAE